MMLFGILVGSFILIAIAILYSGPRLPNGTRTALNEAEISGERTAKPMSSGFANSGGIQIWYETHGNPSGEPVILIMGVGQPLTTWPETFLNYFVQNGYYVITYDHRSTGLSDWMKSWKIRRPYKLEDMANDTLAVLDTLNIDKAHVVGVSMGGMIGQRLAISHNDRVLSLASLMSSGWFYDPELPQFTRKFIWQIARLYLRFGNSRSEKSYSVYRIAVMSILSGTHGPAFEPRQIAAKVLHEFRNRRGYNGKAFWHHLQAIKASGARLIELERISLPVVVIHGTADPLILPSHAEKYAPLIPGAEMVWIAGLGHTLPDWVCEPLCRTIAGNFRKINLQPGHFRIEWKKGTL